MHAKRFGEYTGPSSSGDDTSKTPNQRPTSPAKIDDSVIAKYSGRAVVPDQPASARPSSSRPSSRASSQRPGTSPTPSQRPGTAKPPIDDSVIAKYSGRAVVPDRPASGAGRPSSSAPSRPSSSQRPGTPNLPADLPASGSSRLSSSKPTFDDKKIEVNVYNPSGETTTQGTACKVLHAVRYSIQSIECIPVFMSHRALWHSQLLSSICVCYLYLVCDNLCCAHRENCEGPAEGQKSRRC